MGQSPLMFMCNLRAMGRETSTAALQAIVDRVAPPPGTTSFFQIGYVVPDTAITVERLDAGLQTIGLKEEDVIQHGRFGADTRFGSVEAPGTGALLELIQLDGPTYELFASLRRGMPAMTR